MVVHMNIGLAVAYLPLVHLGPVKSADSRWAEVFCQERTTGCRRWTPAGPPAGAGRPPRAAPETSASTASLLLSLEISAHSNPHVCPPAALASAPIDKRFAQRSYCTPVDADRAQLRAIPSTSTLGKYATARPNEHAAIATPPPRPEHPKVKFSEKGEHVWEPIRNSDFPVNMGKAQCE
eukprot:COSAG03_NODE_3170_length_2164_cov_5.021792_2_plen_179_part_00